MSILRKGKYAGYKGKEFRFIEGENNTIKLFNLELMKIYLLQGE